MEVPPRLNFDPAQRSLPQGPPRIPGGIDVELIQAPVHASGRFRGHRTGTPAKARAGKHVLCEKPMAVSVEKCREMIDACKAAGRLLAVAYRCQFDPNHLECIRIARSGEFGPIRTINAGFGISVGRPGQWRLKHQLSGGGALVDVGVYALQAMRYLSGEEPVEVSAFESKTDPVKFAAVDEQMSWLARFPGGIVGAGAASYNMTGLNAFRVHAERGWFGLDPAFGYAGNRGERSDGKPIALPEPDLFAAEMDDFARCILARRPSKVSGEEGLKDLRIMTAIFESRAQGVPSSSPDPHAGRAPRRGGTATIARPPQQVADLPRWHECE